MSFTVSEIAEILVEAPEDQLALIERIRHWTREGLIQPIGSKHPGTGRHREYENLVLLEVSVLEALAGLGLKVGQQQTALKLLKARMKDGYGDGYEAVKSWIEKGHHRMVIYLAFSNLGGEKPRLDEIHSQIISHLHDLQFRPVDDAVVLVNISQIIESMSRKLKNHNDNWRNRQPERQT